MGGGGQPAPSLLSPPSLSPLIHTTPPHSAGEKWLATSWIWQPHTPGGVDPGDTIKAAMARGFRFPYNASYPYDALGEWPKSMPAGERFITADELRGLTSEHQPQDKHDEL